jgi:hypothetical protein
VGSIREELGCCVHLNLDISILVYIFLPYDMYGRQRCQVQALNAALKAFSFDISARLEFSHSD